MAELIARGGGHAVSGLYKVIYRGRQTVQIWLLCAQIRAVFLLWSVILGLKVYKYTYNAKKPFPEHAKPARKNTEFVFFAVFAIFVKNGTLDMRIGSNPAFSRPEMAFFGGLDPENRWASPNIGPYSKGLPERLWVLRKGFPGSLVRLLRKTFAYIPKEM